LRRPLANLQHSADIGLSCIRVDPFAPAVENQLNTGGKSAA